MMFVYHNVQTVTPENSVCFLVSCEWFDVNEWGSEATKLGIYMWVCARVIVCVHAQAMAAFTQHQTRSDF